MFLGGGNKTSSDEQKFPERVACVVGGVDTLVVGIEWRRRQKHPLVEVAWRVQAAPLWRVLGRVGKWLI